MTLQALVVAPSGDALFATAGHPDPVFRRRGALVPLQQRNYPLGSRAKVGFRSESLRLETGDLLVLYSDGLIEARLTEGEPADGLGAGPVGYPRWQRAVLALPDRPDPQDAEQALRGWFESLVPPGPPDDDITVVVLSVRGGLG